MRVNAFRGRVRLLPNPDVLSSDRTMPEGNTIGAKRFGFGRSLPPGEGIDWLQAWAGFELGGLMWTCFHNHSTVIASRKGLGAFMGETKSKVRILTLDRGFRRCFSMGRSGGFSPFCSSF